MKPSKAAMQSAEGVLAHLGHDAATHHYRATPNPSIASIIDTAIKPLVDAAESLVNETDVDQAVFKAIALRTALANFKQED